MSQDETRDLTQALGQALQAIAMLRSQVEMLQGNVATLWGVVRQLKSDVTPTTPTMQRRVN